MDFKVTPELEKKFKLMNKSGTGRLTAEELCSYFE